MTEQNYAFTIGRVSVEYHLRHASMSHQRITAAALPRGNTITLVDASGDIEPLLPSRDNACLHGTAREKATEKAAKQRVRDELRTSLEADAELIRDAANDVPEMVDVADRLELLAEMVDALEVK